MFLPPDGHTEVVQVTFVRMAVMQQPGIDLICTKKRNYYNVRRGENCAGKKYEMPDIFFSIAKSIQSFNLDINAFE